MPLRIEARAEPSRAMSLATPLIAAALCVVCGSALFVFLGLEPAVVFKTFFVSPFRDLYSLGELSLKIAPLTLCAVGLAIGFRANIWNIGAEGQLVVGAIAGGGLGLAFPDTTSGWLLPAMFLAGALGGMAWAAIPALLKARFDTNEILVTLMLTYVAGLLLSYMVYGPWRAPSGYGWPESEPLHAAARLPRLLEGTRLNLGIVIALAVAGASWLLVARSFVAYQMEVGGIAAGAARYAGFERSRMIWIGLLAGGACAGLAGVVEVAGVVGKLRESVSPGYGFAAIIVAFIGRLHPGGIVLASVLMGLFYVGGEAAKVSLGLPSAVIGVFQGMLLFFLLMSDLLLTHRVRWRSRVADAADA